ncbi:unnamed protein product [Lactuca virosa]|uniref:Uncharacterized protein n=1 Tax=Lactuca virosa TaxID=75947 RepID=A0AAU9MRB4_9ASTR|nr:unnamed protein product [Lactuca virosa]
MKRDIVSCLLLISSSTTIFAPHLDNRFFPQNFCEPITIIIFISLFSFQLRFPWINISILNDFSPFHEPGYKRRSLI